MATSRGPANGGWTLESVTEILIRSRDRDESARDALFARLYDELARVARRQLAGRGATLETAGLINETYLRVVDQKQVDWEDRSHFFAYAARAMRHVLVDRARRRGAQKRGGGQRPVTFTERVVEPEMEVDSILEVDEALDELSRTDSRLARMVELRFFGGLTEEEAAEVLGVSARTVRRDWFKAKAFLHEALTRRGHG
ncbi:MAG: sigma-70 family RNA polymerase sigma factor [Gemmatimonadetes bacterium]|nr:sigma-70 family RNA polymerase sigma factor [Gemmatimonadota bacterium]